MRAALCCASLALWVSPLGAQQSVSIPSTALGDGPVTRTALADVDGDSNTDLIMQSGEALVVGYGIGTYQHVFDAGIPAHDFAVLRGPAGAADELVSVDTFGAWRWSYDPDPVSGTVFVPSGLALTGWEGASRVLTTRDGSQRLIGLDASGHTLLIADKAYGPAPEQRNVPLPGPVLDLISADWRGDPGEEIVLATGNALLVFDPSTATLETTPIPPIEAAMLTRLRQDGYAHDRAAILLRSVGSTTWALHGFDDGLIEAMVPIGDVGAHGLTAADLDLDGDDDLIVGHRLQIGTIQPYVFWNRSNGAPPSPAATTYSTQIGDTWLLPTDLVGDPSPDQAAWPVAGDLTRDGDPDVVTVVEDRLAIALTEGDTIVHAAQQVTVDDGQGYADWLQGNAWMEVDLQLPAVTPESTVQAPDGVLVVQRDAQVVGSGPTAAIGLVPDSGVMEVLELPAPGQPLRIDFWHLAPWVVDEDTFRHVELSLVERDGSGGVVAHGPAKAYLAWLFHEHQLAIAPLLQVEEADMTSVTIVPADGNGGPLGGGGMGPGLDPPGFDGGEGGGGGAPPPPPPPPPPF